VNANLAYASVINAIGQPAPGSVGETLRVDKVNLAHALLTWSPAPGAAAYHIYRSPAPDDGFSGIAAQADALFEDQWALTGAQDSYYLVRSADACGNEE
jgi:hypothetical protein